MSHMSILFVLMFIAEVDEPLRERMRAKAVALNKQAVPDPAFPTAVRCAPERHGLLGMGDCEYPLAEHIIKKAQMYKSFVNKAHEVWATKNSGIIHDIALPPAPRQTKPNPGGQKVKLVRGLLYNILHMMRQRSKKRNKEGIQGDTQHPVLLLKMNNGIVGWCLARAFFRPLCVWGIPLITQNMENDTTVLHLDLPVDRAPQLEDMNAMAEKAVQLDDSDAPSHCAYAVPAYRFRWDSPMQQLHLAGPLQWIEWKLDDVDSEWEGSSNGGGSGDEAASDGGSDGSPDAGDGKEAVRALNLLKSFGTLLPAVSSCQFNMLTCCCFGMETLTDLVIFIQSKRYFNLKNFLI